MSRSNPTESTPNPAVRFYEWDGAQGLLRYYDKALKEDVEVGDDLTFILLDQLSTVKGWHDLSESGIYANEVKDTKEFPITVKAFKGGELARGLYSEIKDKIHSLGGYFVANCYAACRIDGALQICSLQFKGAALNAWVEFSKANRANLYKKAIQIKGSGEGKKGKVVFKFPKFFLKDVSEETNEQAMDLDRQLQAYLEVYLKKAGNAVPSAAEGETGDREDTTDYAEGNKPYEEQVDDDIPF